MYNDTYHRGLAVMEYWCFQICLTTLSHFMTCFLGEERSIKVVTSLCLREMFTLSLTSPPPYYYPLLLFGYHDLQRMKSWWWCGRTDTLWLPTAWMYYEYIYSANISTSYICKLSAKLGTFWCNAGHLNTNLNAESPICYDPNDGQLCAMTPSVSQLYAYTHISTQRL